MFTCKLPIRFKVVQIYHLTIIWLLIFFKNINSKMGNVRNQFIFTEVSVIKIYKLNILKFLQKRRMISLIQIIFLLCSLTSIQGLDCEAGTELQGLFRDSISFKLDNNHRQHSYNYSAPLFENKIPKIALSIQELDIKNLSNIQYQVATAISKPGNINFYLMVNQKISKWRTLRISFFLIAESFSGLSLGYLLFENIKPLQTKFVRYAHKQQPLINKISPNEFITQQVFLSSPSGLLAYTKTTPFQIRADWKFIIQKDNNLLQFSVYSGNSIIKLLRFCYILYKPSKLDDQKYHIGSIHQNLTNSKPVFRFVLSQKLSIFPIRYFLIGFTSLKLKQYDHLSLTLNLFAGHLDFLQFANFSKIDEVKINYLVMGVDMMMSCINCENSYIKETEQGAFCVKSTQCGNNQIPLTNNSLGYSSCRKCLADSVIALTQKGSKICNCNSSYVKEPNGVCNKIQSSKSIRECSDPNSIWSGITKKCQCKQGFFLDDFGFCGGCDQSTSYWDLNSEKCICLPQYIYSQFQSKCVEKGKNCGKNQRYVETGCQCQQFTIKTINEKNQITCNQCPSRKYKVQNKNECMSCPDVCKQCISDKYCLTCMYGYFFKDFKCSSRCGDGIKVKEEQCDDGNFQDFDGCSSQCLLQKEFECKQNMAGNSICKKKAEKPISVSNRTVIEDKNEQKKAIEYKLAISKNSPIYLSSGILIQLLIKPEKERSQNEINQMIKVEVSDKRASPPSIYFSQDSKKLYSVRCYLHYNNQIPSFGFSVKIWAILDLGVWRTVTVNIKDAHMSKKEKVTKSLKPMEDEVL